MRNYVRIAEEFVAGDVVMEWSRSQSSKLSTDEIKNRLVHVIDEKINASKRTQLCGFMEIDSSYGRASIDCERGDAKALYFVTATDEGFYTDIKMQMFVTKSMLMQSSADKVISNHEVYGPADSMLLSCVNADITMKYLKELSTSRYWENFFNKSLSDINEGKVSGVVDVEKYYALLKSNFKKPVHSMNQRTAVDSVLKAIEEKNCSYMEVSGSNGGHWSQHSKAPVWYERIGYGDLYYDHKNQCWIYYTCQNCSSPNSYGNTNFEWDAFNRIWWDAETKAV